jgi:hypothetical protein
MHGNLVGDLRSYARFVLWRLLGRDLHELNLSQESRMTMIMLSWRR